MGAIAAAFDKKGSDAPSAVMTMLEELKHRGTKTPRVASSSLTFIAESINELRREQRSSRTAEGTNSSELILGENYMLAFDGHFFPSSGSTVHQVMHEMAEQPLENARFILKKLDGSFTFAVTFADRILVGRDMMGTKPLYYGENESFCAVASERKALWKIGITCARSFPPGNLAVLNEKGIAFEPVSVLKPLPERKIGMFDAMNRLQKLLEESTRERVSDVRKVAVAFSGGLDSSVIALMAKLAGANVHLICVCLEGKQEVEGAKDAAETLELPFTLQIYTVQDFKNVLPRVLWLIEEPNVMKTSVAVPFYWTAEVASRLGCHVLLAGQGADELFGGYHKYLNDYVRGGAKKVRDALFRDTATSYETNFQRDEPVCTFHKVELRLPFVDREVVSFALSLPIDMKIASKEDQLRKRILREAAKTLGIPSSLADKTKKAAQFSTGVDNALQKLARKEGLTKLSYVNKVFKEVYPAWK